MEAEAIEKKFFVFKVEAEAKKFWNQIEADAEALKFFSPNESGSAIKI